MTGKNKANISVRRLRKEDLAAADRIFRLAFGTFFGLPDPMKFARDADYIRSRWKADPSAAFGASQSGRLLGSNFAANWGSVGVFGPITVHPDCWDQGVGKLLMEPVMECFARWETKHAGLFTFAHSPKHVGFYRKFGFWPGFLTAMMSKPIAPVASAPSFSAYSQLSERHQAECLKACWELTDSIFEGLNVEREIKAVKRQKLGDTLLLWDNTRLAAFAVCHYGPGTEAGSGTCYIKFAAVRPGPKAAPTFERMLDVCEALAGTLGLSRLVAGVNTARTRAYRAMAQKGFRTERQGVIMQRPNRPGYNRSQVYLLDDWH